MLSTEAKSAIFDYKVACKNYTDMEEKAGSDPKTDAVLLQYSQKMIEALARMNELTDMHPLDAIRLFDITRH